MADFFFALILFVFLNGIKNPIYLNYGDLGVPPNVCAQGQCPPASS